MKIVEQGRGTPLVFVSGVQGHWQYSRPTVEALAAHFRVITFSLQDPLPNAERPFDAFGDQIAAAMDQAHIRRAAICGLSFGGLVALNFASRFHDRADALILASTPGPGWSLRPRHEFYTRVPWIFGPLFVLEAPWRAQAELRRALPRWSQRLAFARTMLRTMAAAPMPSAARMAKRARMIGGYDIAAACGRIAAPTLVITGEAGLDHVVNVEGSTALTRHIAGARQVVIENTGHQGSLTKPDVFARIVREFVAGARHAAA